MYRFLIFLIIIGVVARASASSQDVDNEIPMGNDEYLEKNHDEEAIENILNEEDKIENADDGVGGDDEIEIESRDFENLNLEETFEHSVQAYLDNDFDECIAGFTNVNQRYKDYKNAIIKCRLKCREAVKNCTPILLEDIENMHFYEKKVRETLCLLNCNQDYRDVAGTQALRRLSRETEKKLMQLKPYEYLHICYYQKNRFQEAASAVYTYLVRHPKHEMSVQNLRYYLSLPEVKDTDVINLEAEPYVKFYIDGVKAYEEEFYEEAVNKIEKSLESYLKSEDECRIYCEGPFDQGWLPEFTSSVANHFVYCLKCKRRCSEFLNNVNGEYHKDLLATHYDYLQFAYYKLGNIKSTCKAVESYLIFFPADETMLNNKKYYSNLPKVETDFFTPRLEAVEYVKRQEYELRLLKFISDEFSAIDARLSTPKKIDKDEENDKSLENNLGKQDPPPGHSPSSKFMGDNETRLMKNATTWRESQITESLENIRIISGEKELRGKLRYLAEGFLIQSECDSLIQLAKIAAVEGDGYDDNKSPHSKYEMFEGLTVGKIALMVYFGLLNPKQLELFLRSSEKARIHVEKYFNLDRHLYFSYTHLVCRTALPGKFVITNKSGNLQPRRSCGQLPGD